MNFKIKYLYRTFWFSEYIADTRDKNSAAAHLLSQECEGSYVIKEVSDLNWSDSELFFVVTYDTPTSYNLSKRIVETTLLEIDGRKFILTPHDE